MPKFCSMVLTSWPGPWVKAALMRFSAPVPAIGTTRSRGMDSIETRLQAGSTLTTRVVSLRWPPTSP